MKSLKLLSLVVFAITFCLSITSVHAQYVPVPSTIRTPYGNVNTTTYQYMPMYHGYGTGSMSLKHEFKIMLKNDSLITVNSRIDIQDSVHFIKYKVKGTQHVIKPEDTKEIYRYSSGKKIMGIPTDSCWLFKADEGKINSYSYVAEEGLAYVVAIQDGDVGEIVPLTKDNLMYIIGDVDDKLMRLIEKHKFNKAIELFNKRAREGDLSTNK